jgi:hypothetical protein
VTVQDLRGVLKALLDIEPTPDELADTLWLATLASRNPDGETTIARPRTTSGPQSPGAGAPSQSETDSREDKPGRGPAPSGDCYIVRLPDDGSPGTAPSPVPITTSLALPSALSLARALRPMRRHRVPGTDLVLDEAATADFAAEQHLWLPVLKPVREPALDLALVIDASESMQLWTGLAREFRALCERLGAFRHIQTWHLVPPGDGYRARPAVRGASPSSPLHDPGEILDPSGRRLILVVTDGVHPGWRSGGTIRPVLARWSTVNPIAIVQTLPQRLWDRTWLRTFIADFHRNSPGTCSAEPLRPQRRPPGSVASPDPQEAIIPVLELTQDVLSRWAHLVTGLSRSVRLAGVALPAQADGKPTASQRGDVLGAIAHTDPVRLVSTFRKSVSPTAYRLAGRLSVVAPLTLPVMRLVMESTVSGAGSAELAEVFLGGLLRRLPEQPDDGPDQVMYGFAAGVRNELQPSLTRHEAITVLDQVGSYLARGQRTGRAFQAIVDNPAGRDIMIAAEKYPPFARVTREVFDRLGGPFADAARHLAAGALTPSIRVPIAVQRYSEQVRRGEFVDGAPSGESQRDMSLVPPPPPRQLRVQEDPEKRVVRLTWEVPAEPGCVSVVVRADGTRPPASPAGPGKHVVYQGAWDDLDPRIGQPMMYAVYTQRGGGGACCERPAVTTEPVLLALRATLSAVPGDRAVELSWDRPQHAAGVEIRREQIGAGRPPKRIPLPDGGGRQWTDREVTNGVGYRYTAVAIYEIASPGRSGPQLRQSKATRCDVVPTVPPEVPGPVSAEGFPPPEHMPLYDHRVELGLPPVARGVLKIVRGGPGVKRLREGAKFPEEELAEYGTTLNGAEDIWRDSGQLRRYTPVLVLHGWCYAGPTRDYARGPEVRDLAAEHLGAVIRVTWSWPDGVGKARVTWDEATDVADPANAARYTEVSRVAGASTGQYDIAAQPADRLFVKVATVVRDEAGGEYLTSGLPARAQRAAGAPEPPPRHRRGVWRRGPEH